MACGHRRAALLSLASTALRVRALPKAAVYDATTAQPTASPQTRQRRPSPPKGHAVVLEAWPPSAPGCQVVDRIDLKSAVMADSPEPEPPTSSQEFPGLSQEALSQIANHEGVHKAVEDGTLKELIESSPSLKAAIGSNAEALEKADHETLKYHLLGPSLTKAGQDSVDQKQVSEIIYNASKGSKFFNNEEVKDRNLTEKISRILAQKRQLDKLDLSTDRRRADEYITQLELSRDLSQNIVHLDCDAFYAAVEELDRPELRELPMAVGQGVLTTCNYVARKFGCRSGMAGFVAKKLCPELVSLPLNFDKYTAKAQEVRAVLAQYDPRFQSSSIDEAYLNITDYCAEHEMDPVDVVSQLRAHVFREAKITVSAGLAANAMLAKICSNHNKPNGQFHLASDRAAILAFMRDLPTRKVNGVGRVFERELDAIGIKTCGDVYAHRALLPRLFGDKAFRFLAGVHLGVGATALRPAEEHERKSVGTESTFRDMRAPAELRARLRRTADELEADLRRAEVKGRTLVLKVKLHTYEVLTRQAVTPFAVARADDLFRFALPMLERLMRDTPVFTLRLLGLRCTHLVSTKKGDVDAFFGRARSPVRRDADGWEVWPAPESDEGAAVERGSLDDDDDDDAKLPVRRHGKEIAPNPAPPRRSAQPDTWRCPICALPQGADDASFNAHIDLCLSRPTIAAAVQQTQRAASDVSQAPTAMPGRKRARSRNDAAPKGNKKLSFA